MRRVLAELADVYNIIGGVISAGSLVSLVTKYYRVGLAPILQEFVDYYRKITHFLVDLLFFWLPLQLPNWYKDLYVISFVLIAALARTYRAASPWRLPYWWLPASVAGTIVLSLPLLGLLFMFHPLISEHIARKANPSFDLLAHEEQEKILKTTSFAGAFHLNLVTMVIATVAFFALNSQL